MTLHRRLACLVALIGGLLWGQLHAQPFADSLFGAAAPSQASVAHRWSRAQLFAIRNDFARPPVHARNLYHLAAAMYDAWALFDARARPLFLDSGAHRACAMDPWTRSALQELTPAQTARLRDRVVSQSAWRVIRHRYRNAVEARLIRAHVDALAERLQLTDSAGQTSVVLGKQIADCVIGAGRRDNANEDGNHANLVYAPVNPPLNPILSGNPDLERPSRWQPLALGAFVDQAGRAATSTEFIGAEWGDVDPYALDAADRSTIERDGYRWTVYHDPGPPPRHDDPTGAFAQQFALVLQWSAHLDPAAQATIDLTPPGRTAAAGADDLERDPLAQLDFYDPAGGQNGLGDMAALSFGTDVSGVVVPLGDYTRVVAEYWADGPDSETPPGHWFQLYNDHVSAHPELVRRVAGEGKTLDALAFDVIAYLALGGAMHDAAIAAWGTKGAYDYVRPISAIRFLAEQSDKVGGPGLPLVPGRIERIRQGDPLAGPGGMNIGAIKVFAWRGPAAIDDPAQDVAGVDWILARDWWPYQRPNFVTPPFAGYVSGHSTFSRAAAVVLERLTGTPAWPGGSAGFTAAANDFLVFERGPSVDVPLRWATYRDAADETSLSRIYGGIHHPADDLAGRWIGVRVGEDAWERTLALVGDAVGLGPAQTSAGTASKNPDAIVPAGGASGCASRGDRRAGDTALLLMLGCAGAGLGRRRRRRVRRR